MSAAFYNRMAKTGLNLLKKRGRTVVLRSFTPGGGGRYDPATGKAVVNGQASTKDETRYAAIMDAPEGRIGLWYGAGTQKDSLIGESNKWVYIDAKGMEPTVSHQLIFDNRTYDIINVIAYSPAGIPVLYLLTLKS